MIPSTKRIYLCSPDRQPVIQLNGLRTSTVDYHAQVKGYSELSFEIDRYLSINGQFVESNGYEELKPYMYLYFEDIGFFQMQAPTLRNDGNVEYKEIQAYSAEKEFENKDWQGVKINTGESDSIEYLYEDNLDGLGFAKRYVVVYDTKDTRFSFLHLILEKVSYWEIGYVDPNVMSKQIPSIDINNENLYAVMTSDVAPRLQCLFVFDFKNFEINVYGRDNIDYDTGIYIGFRNLAKDITVDVDQDSIYTRFTVAGADDLNLRYYNYGSDQIFNIDYFLGEPYMSEELAQKIRNYIQFREDHKLEYIEYAKDAIALNDKIYDLKYTVPSDELYWRNWDNMNEEGLKEHLEYYNNMLEAFQIKIDERPNEEKFSNYGTDDEKYNPILNDQGEVDHEYYLNILYENMGIYSGYYTYKEIIDYILPYINLALDNIERVKYGEEVLDPEKDLGMVDPAENWDLYGYEELEGVRKSYEDDLSTKLYRYRKPWDQMTDEEKIRYNLNYGSSIDYENSYQRQQYVHYEECLGEKEHPIPGTIYYRLKELEEQINNYQSELDVVNTKLGEYNNLMRYDITTVDFYKDASGKDVDYKYIPGSLIALRNEVLFTEDEIALITTLFHDTDYTNSNIFTTSLDSVYTTLDKQKELLEDATDKLIEVSQPQYNFSVSLDNLLRLTKYEGWYSDFKTLRFIRLGIREDYSIKLRIIGYRWNPCDVAPDLQLEFSNMISSKSGRSDIVQLLELENNVASKNSISIGNGNAKTSEEYVSNLIQMLAKNSIFTKTITGIAGNTTGQVDTATIENIVSDYIGALQIDANSINVKNITGTTAEFEEVFTDYLSSDVIYAKFADMDEAHIKELSTEIITFGEDSITEITGNYIQTASISADQIEVTDAFVSDVLTVGKDTITTITGDYISTATLNADNINVTDAFVENVINVGKDGITQIAGDYIQTAQISADNVNVTSAFVDKFLQVGSEGLTTLTNNAITTETVIARLVDASAVQAENVAAKLVTSQSIITGLLTAEEADFENMSADNAFIEYLNANVVSAGHITTQELEAELAKINILESEVITADSAFLKSLQSINSTSVTNIVNDAYIANAIVGKINVGDLAAGNIVLNDTMQILSENGSMVMNGKALQILGTDKDGNSYVGIQLGYDSTENPSLILRNDDGAVILSPSGITENAIANELIVNDMIKTGTISESKLDFKVMKEGDTVTLEQIYVGDKQFGAEWNEFVNGTNTNIENLKSELDDKNVYSLYISTPNGTNIRGGSIELRANLFRNNVDVTEEYDDSCFTWIRMSENTVGDSAWNDNHKQGAKSIIINSSDVDVNAIFQCKFEYENITVSSEEGGGD